MHRAAPCRNVPVTFTLELMGWLPNRFKRTTPSREQILALAADASAEVGDRDDAILALSDFDDPEVEDVLLKIASDASEDEMLTDEAGHALWIIWDRQGKAPLPDIVARMQPSARKFFAP